MAVISRWNVEGELQSPICITWLTNVPRTVANAVFGIEGRSMHICSYASDISSFDRYAARAISFQMISWSGNGVMSLTVLLFCSRMSNTVLSLPLFFGMHNIGTAWCASACFYFWSAPLPIIVGSFNRWASVRSTRAPSGLFSRRPCFGWSFAHPGWPLFFWVVRNSPIAGDDFIPHSYLSWPCEVQDHTHLS